MEEHDFRTLDIVVIERETLFVVPGGIGREAILRRVNVVDAVSSRIWWML